MTRLERILAVEPAVLIATLEVLLDAAIIFGFDLSVEQAASVVAVTRSVATLLTRAQVWAPASHAAALRLERVQAYDAGKTQATLDQFIEQHGTPPADR